MGVKRGTGEGRGKGWGRRATDEGRGERRRVGARRGMGAVLGRGYTAKGSVSQRIGGDRIGGEGEGRLRG